MIGPLLALGSAVTWGVADFSGGMLSRRLPSAAVVGVSQACSLVLLLVLLPLIVVVVVEPSAAAKAC